ncbi:hypothetical protein KUBF_37000 [Bacteroides finegoldii]|nr:hypothetical protein KUBF_37000 [Bacteroides finegoldii]
MPGNDKQRMSLRMNLDQKLGHIGYALLSVNGGYAKTNTRTALLPIRPSWFMS